MRESIQYLLNHRFGRGLTIQRKIELITIDTINEVLKYRLWTNGR